MTNKDMEQELDYIVYNGYKYWYEYRLAKDRVDICLATRDPKKYCNGVFLFSTKDPGTGMEYVIVKSDDPKFKTPPITKINE